MSTTTSTTAIKAEGKQLTFGELREFIAQCMRVDTPDDATFDVDMTWSAKLRGLTTAPPVH